MVQVYNDDGALGGYGEIEHHSAAVLVGAGNRTTVERIRTTIRFVPR